MNSPFYVQVKSCDLRGAGPSSWKGREREGGLGLIRFDEGGIY